MVLYKALPTCINRKNHKGWLCPARISLRTYHYIFRWSILSWQANHNSPFYSIVVISLTVSLISIRFFSSWELKWNWFSRNSICSWRAIRSNIKSFSKPHHRDSSCNLNFKLGIKFLNKRQKYSQLRSQIFEKNF